MLMIPLLEVTQGLVRLELLSFGRHFRYHVNADKTWLTVKTEHLAPAQHIFDDAGIQIMSAGRPYMGVPLGSLDFIADYTHSQISKWVQGLSLTVVLSCFMLPTQFSYMAFPQS